MKIYKNDELNNIAFPLGGIGSGSISIAGNGQLVDPEINNRPNREAGCGYTGFAVKAECNGEVVDCRLLNGDRTKDLSGTIRGAYGLGDDFFAGFRHFSKVEFKAAFPFAVLNFSDSVFPATVTMEAFNPFIPSNDKDSSLPVAMFNITLQSTAAKKMTFRVLQNVTNLLTSFGPNLYSERGSLKCITLNGAGKRRNSAKYGNMTAATNEAETSHTDYWFRGGWFDRPTMFMNALTAPGPLKNRVYNEPHPQGWNDSASLEAGVTLAPGESHTFRFLLSWYVPAAHIYWRKGKATYYKNYYATLFKNSGEVADYCFKHWNRLYEESQRFANALQSSSLPPEVQDAINGNLAILKSSTCLRLEDGSFWAWEGVKRRDGSCEGTCQHVWNYAYALPFLFPQMERRLRTNELDYNLEKSGMMHFRMDINRQGYWGGRSCVDGQMGTVIKCYREWKLSGDDSWLRQSWPKIKLCLEYAWSAENFDRWDPEKSGLITGRQHHTLDVELFGVYAWLTGMYHAALLAGAEMAEFLGETKAATEYRQLFEKGQKQLDEKTFNGEYYIQLLKVSEKSKIQELTHNESDFSYYWDEESQQAKYQIENGCEIDQVLADWHADLVGLPNVFVPAHRKAALQAIYQYNFKKMHDLLNPCRVFACNDEKGVVMCQWPRRVQKPQIPVPYSEECMSGFEYAVAANMLQCGMEKQALEIVRAIRMRYDGKRRNPFAELECGASYSRAMASYSFLLIYSGFQYNLSQKTMGFKPLKNGQYFWSVDGAWGTVRCEEKRWELAVEYGALELSCFVTTLNEVQQVLCNQQKIAFSRQDDSIHLNQKLTAGDVLVFA